MNGRLPNSRWTALKNSAPGTRHPLATLGGRRAGRYVPGRRKAAEVIEPNHVHVSQQSPQAVDAPAIAGLAKRLPIVNRIAPELSLSAEVVGRHSGDEARPVLVRRAETVPGWPRHRSNPEKRKMAGRRSGARLWRARSPSGVRLAEQQKLRKANLIDLAASVLARLGQSRRCCAGPTRLATPGNRRRCTWLSAPETERSRPASAPCSWQNCSYAGRRSWRAPGSEVCPGLFEQPVFERDDGVVIDGRCWKRRPLRNRRGQQSVLDQASPG